MSHTIFEYTVTLTSDLVSIISLSGAYTIVFEEGIPKTNVWCVDASWGCGVSLTILGSLRP